MVRRHWYLLADLIILVTAAGVGYWARFEGAGWRQELAGGRLFVALSAAVTLLVFWAAGVYRVVWRHSASRDFVRLGAAGALAGALNVVLGVGPLMWTGLAERRVPMSVLAFLWLATILGPASLRALERMLFVASPGRRFRGSRSLDRRARRVLVIGAGEAGRMIV
ncbi:MAG TPA: hypothetical protein PLL69_08410, partial [Gemmatimonadales bacterium]|nr:hypothetical protein [Gemmatimonadales bacterium]